MLLLESRGEAGPGRDRSKAAVTRTAPSRTGRETSMMAVSTAGNNAVPSTTFGRTRVPSPLPTVGRRTRAQQPESDFGVGSKTGSKTRRRRRSEGDVLVRAKGKSNHSMQRDHHHRGLRMPSIQRDAVDVVGRDIACVRKGRRNIFSDSSINCGEIGAASPGLLVADEARGVMFGLGARLGRHSEREDRWL